MKPVREQRVKRACQVGMLLSTAALFLTSACVTHSADLTLGDPRGMAFKPVEFSPPEPDRVVLDNGMVLYLLEDHELPLVTMTATMKTGSWLDPTEKVGLAAMTGAVMRTGGGGGLSAEHVDAELEQFAGDVSIGRGRRLWMC
jgi:zinc protease